MEKLPELLSHRAWLTLLFWLFQVDTENQSFWENTVFNEQPAAGIAEIVESDIESPQHGCFWIKRTQRTMQWEKDFVNIVKGNKLNPKETNWIQDKPSTYSSYLIIRMIQFQNIGKERISAETTQILAKNSRILAENTKLSEKFWDFHRKPGL